MTATKLSRPFRERNALEHLGPGAGERSCPGNRDLHRRPRETFAEMRRFLAVNGYREFLPAAEGSRKKSSKTRWTWSLTHYAPALERPALSAAPFRSAAVIVPSGATLVKTCIR